MDIRSVFEKIANEYPEAKKQTLKNHPLAKFIRSEVPKSFKDDLGQIISKYKVLVAKHAGNWKNIHSEEFENKYGAKKNKSYY
jgi:hypothetical protein